MTNEAARARGTPNREAASPTSRVPFENGMELFVFGRSGRRRRRGHSPFEVALEEPVHLLGDQANDQIDDPLLVEVVAAAMIVVVIPVVVVVVMIPLVVVPVRFVLVVARIPLAAALVEPGEPALQRIEAVEE